MIIKQFCDKHNITKNQFLGIDKIDGFLDLRSLTSIPEGFNPTVGGFLYLRSLTSIPEGFNPTCGGSLDLRSLTSIPEGFNPTVGGFLDLRSLTSIPECFNPTCGGSLDLRSLTSIPEGFNPTVGGFLYLRSLTSIPEGFNPTVGGFLDLSSLTSIPEGFNPTCGWSLYLSSLTSIPEGFNPTCGGSLDLWSLKGQKPTPKKYNNEILSWQNGKYISADNIFCEVIHKKENIYKVKKIGNDKTFYIVSDGKSTHSHGDSLKKAKEDLEFKLISETLKKEPINEDTTIDINRYRIITGACEFGVKQWMETNGITEDKIKASELLPILQKTNAYGHEKFKKLITF